MGCLEAISPGHCSSVRQCVSVRLLSAGDGARGDQAGERAAAVAVQLRVLPVLAVGRRRRRRARGGGAARERRAARARARAAAPPAAHLPLRPPPRPHRAAHRGVRRALRRSVLS